MDFMKLLKSIEELLYEIVSWALFYPITLWRCLRHPHNMMNYAKTELQDDGVGRFDDALSPPIFLLLTMFFAYLLQLIVEGPSPPLGGFFDSEQNLLFSRAVAFSLFPLILALRDVRQRGARVTKQVLKPAFYSQCYATVPFVLALDLALIVSQHGTTATTIAAILIFLAGLAWYFSVEVAWVESQGETRRLRAILEVAGNILLGFAVILAGLTMVALSIMNHAT
ncbi:permease [Devosia ginsengisoli]|uniref:permease n=1 Tax=Devosia ginsengisoli TaxID=400770 RepID=UPI0026EBC51B|nr:permease [Devosia ginsengisoli]MCR6671230.1 permease [Devosia ginsengisoli]